MSAYRIPSRGAWIHAPSITLPKARHLHRFHVFAMQIPNPTQDGRLLVSLPVGIAQVPAIPRAATAV